VWSKDCDEAFLTLKKLLTTSLVLAQLDIAKPFDDYYDASGTSLGCVLMQEGRLISYSLQQLRCHEEHYPTHDFELPAMIMALRTWQYYLLGNVVHIYLYPTGSKYETNKMTRVDQGLLARSALPPREGKCHCGCAESQGSLQLLTSCTFY
jgi:hypothetical protein